MMRGKKISLGKGGKAPASQRQKLEQLSGFRLAHSSTFNSLGRWVNRLSIILGTLPKLGFDLPYMSRRGASVCFP